MIILAVMDTCFYIVQYAAFACCVISLLSNLAHTPYPLHRTVFSMQNITDRRPPLPHLIQSLMDCRGIILLLGGIPLFRNTGPKKHMPSPSSSMISGVKLSTTRRLLGSEVQLPTLSIGSTSIPSYHFMFMSRTGKISCSPVQAAHIGTHCTLLFLNAILYAPHSRYL